MKARRRNEDGDRDVGVVPVFDGGVVHVDEWACAVTVYRKNREARCGWCITGDHEHCVVVVEAGLRDTSRTVKDPKWSKVPKPKMAPWRCRCWECEPWLTTRCVKCQRRGVEVDPYTSECVKDCSKVKKVPQPPVREIRVS